jgi:hypothetical protein
MLFRIFAALIFFIGYSIALPATTTTYSGYNTTAEAGNTITSGYTVTNALPDAIGASLGYFTVIYFLMLIASILIDIIMARKEKE